MTTRIGSTCTADECQNPASYRCPTCNATTCSVRCYQAHSPSCLEKFSAAASDSLRNLNVSESERRRFHKLLRQIQLERNEDSILDLSSHDSPSCQTANETNESSQEHPDTADSSDDSDNDDPAQLLQQLLANLDDNGKDALFTVLQKAMSEQFGDSIMSNNPTPSPNLANREPPTSQTLLKPPAPLQANVLKDQPPRQPSTKLGLSAKRTNPPYSKDKGPIADILEHLLDDIDGLDLSYDEILSRLPRTLVEDFHSRLRNGQTADLVKLWRPWWEPVPEIDGIRESDKTADVPVLGVDSAGVPPLPAASDLVVDVGAARRRASPAMLFCVLDVLFAYCVSMRLCNGDWQSDTQVVARTMWEASGALGGDVRHSSLAEACRSCSERAHQRWSAAVASAGLVDLGALLGGCSSWVAPALFETERLLRRAKSGVDKRGMKALDAAVKKVAFFVAWALGLPSDTLLQAARDVNNFVDKQGYGSKEMEIASRVGNQSKSNRVSIVLETEESAILPKAN